MSKFIFVIYQQGLGGENLSTRISHTPNCEPLTSIKTAEDRTIIQNDFFGKFFIHCPIIINGKTFFKEKHINQVKNFFLKKKQIERYTKNIVVPCHFKIKNMLKEFPDEKFVIIDPPHKKQEQQKILESNYKKVWLYTLNTQLEILGHLMFVKNWLKFDPDVKSIITKIKGKKITVGELCCYSKNLEPTEKNQKQIFYQLYKDKLKTQKIENIKNKKNILRLSYIDSQTITGNEVIKRLFKKND